jgi:hypothetical protein
MGKLLLVHKYRTFAPRSYHGFHIRVAMAPLAIAVRHTLRVENPPHLVRFMAIDAGRDEVRLLLPQFPADDLPVY